MAVPLQAQIASATLSGTITDASGKGVANAKVSVKNLATGQVVETQTDSAGLYGATNLVPGDYELSASADGFSTNTAKVTISCNAAKPFNSRRSPPNILLSFEISNLAISDGSSPTHFRCVCQKTPPQTF